MNQVQLLVADEGNRRALAELLRERYAVDTDQTVQTVDCHIVDDRTLPEYREPLLAYKREHQPLFCPVILIRREDTEINIKLPDPDATDCPQLVDEIMTAPVDKTILFRRLSNLLVRRANTRTLIENTNRLDRFASMLAHELRNPVNIGQIYSQQLSTEANATAVEYIGEAFDRLETMIDILLVLARGREAVSDPTTIQLADTTQAAWDVLDTKDATLVTEVNAEIQADETYIQHFFRNLFKNAIEHGGADVTVTVGGLQSGFYVADNGTGISPAERETVFEAGYTTASEHGGTGLGLAFVRELADIYDWEWTVTESNTGGARFEFTNVDLTLGD
ncbi:sensor histidine kinase [Haloarcula nitratireducens]|uniref:histidine kinase n=1 Tax=Haloarcula nitratireducens TaxID=2487749 RepID=A0AAW4PLR2_9EURY|nr:HAMP domain-containing sensor histidine kinase [Halomicroarcula nitratireducens]MBX0298220.1 HAMP domain-containing histidine kinase [Halomicroarcula nitratireducens]